MSHTPASHTPASPSHSKVLSAAYLERTNNKKELVKRLRTVSDVLNNDHTVEPDSSDFPGLAALSATLVSNFLNHKDKEVRLYAVLCCMELFAVYAPEAPWSDAEICAIFSQTIRQLSNLSHTTNKSHANYGTYERILDLLAVVKIGVVLVDVAKNNDINQDDDEDSPLGLLAELIRTALQSLRPAHPPVITENVQKMISGCLEEYYGGVSIPFPLVEEILVCVGRGPKLWITNPDLAKSANSANNKKGKAAKKTTVPYQVQTDNPSYAVATKIIRHNMDGLSTPIANLLNGLINGESHIVQHSSIVGVAEDEEDGEADRSHDGPDVWAIIYQVGKIAPAVLTTVLGTVTNCLTLEGSKRRKAVCLLGKLFSNQPKLAAKFAPSFRQWLNRYSDIEEATRLLMVEFLIAIVKYNKDQNVVQDSEQCLMNMMEYDKAKEVRFSALEAVCDYAVNPDNREFANPVSENLLMAVGSRVQSKSSDERKKALTGLGQIFYFCYMRDVLGEIDQAEGDDCDVELISRILTENCSHATIFAKQSKEREGAAQAREKYRFIASRIFECLCFTDEKDPEMRHRAAQIIDDLMLGSDASKNAKKKVSPTAKVVGLAIILDSLRNPGENVIETGNGSSNAFRYMKSFFRQRLELQKALGTYLSARSAVREYASGSEEAALANKVALKNLKTVAAFLPKPSNDAVLDAFHSARDKRIFQTLNLLARSGHTRATRNRALEELPKRTHSLGDGVAEWMGVLVRRCSMGSFINTDIVEDSIRWAEQCMSEGNVTCATALLSSANLAIAIFPSICGQTESFDALKSILSSCVDSSKCSAAVKKMKRQVTLTCVTSLLPRVARATREENSDLDADGYLDKAARKQLLQLCTTEGTPQQSRNAVATLATLFTPLKGSEEPADNQAFAWLLKELTVPSKMSVNSEEKESAQLVSILSALSALVECAPGPFSRSTKGESAVKFALQKVLLGRGSSSDNGDDSDSDSSNTEDETPKKSAKKNMKGDNLSPVGKSLLENSDLSIACRRICAAIEFLVAYVRATIAASQANDEESQAMEPSADRLRSLFDVLSQIVHDHGIPPSKRDRTFCRTRQDRAAIRQCAAVHLLRLCASRLKLEQIYLTTNMWHVLGGVFLDEERTVREAMMGELYSLLQGVGFFANDLPPRLRFAALAVLCADGEARNISANGGAANVGNQRVGVTKAAAARCFGRLRITLKASSRHYDEEDEALEELKTLYMPENAVPFAFHLLACRRETPEEASKGSETATKMLKKRLKMIFDPLTQSLGDSADNIEFLLRMTATLSQCALLDSATDGTSAGTQAKLKVVCEVAKEVLDKSVKTDVNLVSHAVAVRVPPALYQRKPKKRKRASKESASRDTTPESGASKKTKGSNQRPIPNEVNFLGEGVGDSPGLSAASGEGIGAGLNGVSPIAKSGSPASSLEEEKTLSPELTGATAPINTQEAAAALTRLCTQSVLSTPNNRAKMETEDSPSTVVPQTQDSEETQESEENPKYASNGDSGKGKRGNKKGKVPLAIQLDDDSDRIKSRSRRKGSDTVSSEEEEKAKPLGNSNKANKRSKRTSEPTKRSSSRRSTRLSAQ